MEKRKEIFVPWNKMRLSNLEDLFRTGNSCMSPLININTGVHINLIIISYHLLFLTDHYWYWFHMFLDGMLYP